MRRGAHAGGAEEELLLLCELDEIRNRFRAESFTYHKDVRRLADDGDRREILAEVVRDVLEGARADGVAAGAEQDGEQADVERRGFIRLARGARRLLDDDAARDADGGGGLPEGQDRVGLVRLAQLQVLS